MTHPCRAIRQLLEAYHDGELPPRRRATVQLHLEGCPGCAAELRSLEATERLLVAARPEGAPMSPAESKAVFAAALAASGVLERRGRRGWNWTWCVASLVGISLAASGTYLGTHLGGAPAVQTVAIRPVPRSGSLFARSVTPSPAETPRAAPHAAGVPWQGARLRSRRAFGQHRRHLTGPAHVVLPAGDPSQASELPNDLLLTSLHRAGEERLALTGRRLMVVASRVVAPLKLEVTVRTAAASERETGYARAVSTDRNADGSCIRREYTAACDPNASQSEEGVAGSETTPLNTDPH